MNGDYVEFDVEGLDRVGDAFGYAFPKGSLVLIEAESGGGKSVLSQRFVYGFCENGLSVSYISPEFDSKSFVKQMNSLSYEIIDYMITSRQLEFYKADLDTEDIMAEKFENRTLATSLVKESAIWENEIVIIDSFHSLLKNDPQFQRTENKQQYLQNMMKRFENKDATIILTLNPLSFSHVDPVIINSDIYFSISVESVGGSMLRSVDVVKYTQQISEVDDIITFTVQEGQGLNIRNQTVS